MYDVAPWFPVARARRTVEGGPGGAGSAEALWVGGTRC